ncbi:MAG: hypothetical protein Q8N46_01920, partial [Anaerolineales bacterium]|nr:hypothetical protein [Anaerolineales bacterium]
DLGTVTTTLGGTLTIETNAGSITDSGVITASGISSFTTSTTNDDITLNSTNVMTGAVSVATTGATGDATLDNGTTALNLGTVSVGGNLLVTCGEAITDSGVITVGGTAGFTTDVNDKAITLDSSNAITGAITFTTQTGGTNAAHVTLNNGSTAISLAAFTTEGNLTLTTTAAIALAGHTVNGNLSVTSSNAITQTAALTVTGTSSFTTNASNMAITLSTTTNAFTGAMSFTTTGTGDVTIDNGATALNLGTVSVGRNLLVTCGEAITDSGVITVGGTAGFTADLANISITLDQISSFTGAVSLATSGASGNISLTNAAIALDLGTVTTTLGGTLT